MHVTLDGSEISRALVDLARAKLGIKDGDPCSVETALCTGDQQLDPLRCMAVIRVVPIAQRRARSR